MNHLLALDLVSPSSLGGIRGSILNALSSSERLSGPLPHTRSLRWKGEETRVMESADTQARRGEVEDYWGVKLVRHIRSLARGILHPLDQRAISTFPNMTLPFFKC